MTRFLDCSAVGLLLALAVMLFFGAGTDVSVILPHDPIFGISVQYLFWIGAAIASLIALIILLNRESFWPQFFVASFSINVLVYLFAFYLRGGRGLIGYFGGVSRAFEVSEKTADVLIFVAIAHLLVMSCCSLVQRWRYKISNKGFLKARCPACGLHFKFFAENEGQQSTCPNCNAAISLRGDEELVKATCFFCKGHIEFRAYALGERILCPHCQRQITLRDSIPSICD